MYVANNMYKIHSQISFHKLLRTCADDIAFGQQTHTDSAGDPQQWDETDLLYQYTFDGNDVVKRSDQNKHDSIDFCL